MNVIVNNFSCHLPYIDLILLKLFIKKALVNLFLSFSCLFLEFLVLKFCFFWYFPLRYPSNHKITREAASIFIKIDVKRQNSTVPPQPWTLWCFLTLMPNKSGKLKEIEKMLAKIWKGRSPVRSFLWQQ